MNKDAFNIVRQLWYDENNKDTSNMDKRELAIHVGKKSGLMLAMNSILKASYDMSDKGYQLGDLNDIPERDQWPNDINSK